jgi:hypothetical protein
LSVAVTLPEQDEYRLKSIVSRRVGTTSAKRAVVVERPGI